MANTPLFTQWANAVGNAMIKSVEFTVGGDAEPRWYCDKCGASHGDTKPAGRCDQRRTKPRQDRVERAYEGHLRFLMNNRPLKDVAGMPCPCAQCQNWVPEDMGDEHPTIEDCIYDNFEVFEEYCCDSTAFTRRKKPGHVIDRLESDYMHMYNELIDRPDHDGSAN